MIRLYQFAPAFGLPNASPFCMKLEVWLQLAGLPYECVNNANVLRMPKGKLPCIEDGGALIADSSFCVAYLSERYHVNLDADLQPAQRATALAFQRLFEEDLYWALLYSRWIDEAGWPKTREAFFGFLPGPLRALVPMLARRGMRRELHGHGMGRHSASDIYAIGQRDLGAVADFLADKPFMLGEQPHSIDAVAYAFLANVLWAPFDTPLQRFAQTRPNLEAYCWRVRERLNVGKRSDAGAAPIARAA